MNTEADIRFEAELRRAGLVKQGLPDFTIVERLSLLENLINNADKIDTALWLRWLTANRQVLRFASVTPDEDWIKSKKFSSADRRRFNDDTVFPLYESGGSIVCASLSSSEELVQRYSERLNMPVVLVGPTLCELREIKRFYPN